MATPNPRQPLTSEELCRQFFDTAFKILDGGVQQVFGHIYVIAPSGNGRYFAGEMFTLLKGFEFFLYLNLPGSVDIEIPPDGKIQGEFIAGIISADEDGANVLAPQVGEWPENTPRKRASRRSTSGRNPTSVTPQTTIIQQSTKKLPCPLFSNTPGYDEDDGNYAVLPPDINNNGSLARALNCRCHVASHIPNDCWHLYGDVFLRPDFTFPMIETAFNRLYVDLRPVSGHSLLTEENYRTAISTMTALASLRELNRGDPYQLFLLTTAYSQQVRFLITTLGVVTAQDKRGRLEEILTRLETEEAKVCRLRHPTFADLSFLSRIFRAREKRDYNQQNVPHQKKNGKQASGQRE